MHPSPIRQVKKEIAACVRMEHFKQAGKYCERVCVCVCVCVCVLVTYMYNVRVVMSLIHTSP